MRTVLAEPVIVTSQLETNSLAPGASTVLHVFAQIAPEFRDTSAQIFSWNVDLLVNGAAIQLDLSDLRRPLSDNDPLASFDGQADGPHIRSIRDTFISVTNAGRNAPIELFSVPVRAVAPGVATLSLQGGTRAEEPDFVVEPIGDGPTLIGGDYSQSSTQIEVLAPLTNLLARISETALPDEKRLITIRFPVEKSHDYFVEANENPAATVNWLALPGAPHQLGFADDTNSAPHRFYRVRARKR